MTKESRQQALEEALDYYDATREKDFDGNYFEILFSAYRSFSEDIVGDSFLKIGKHLQALAEASDNDGIGRIGSLTVRKTNPTKTHHKAAFLTLQVLSDDGTPRYRMDWSKPDNKDFFEIDVFEIDPDRPDYDYPELIAGATVFPPHRDGASDRARGHCRMRDFGKFIDVMDVVRPALGVPVHDDGSNASFRTMEDLLDADGGIAGDLAKEVVVTMQAHVTKTMMDWARNAIAEVAAEQERRGLVWGKSYLLYNDLDDYSFRIPLAGDRIALFHKNISLISDWYAYVAVADLDEDGQVKTIALTPLKRGVDHEREFVEGLIAGNTPREPNIVHDFATGTTAFKEEIDSTDVLSTFAFYLHVDHEMICEGAMDGDRKNDADIKTNFSVFDLEEDDLDEDFEDEDSPEGGATPLP